MRAFSVLSFIAFLLAAPAHAQIVTNGKTNTSVQVNGSVTGVTTTTVKGANAFNSFSQFDVNAGKTANLYLPNGTSNLINVVTSNRTDIDGTLNSIKDGRVGGNVYFANPSGFVVSSTGVVNVGSLTVTTPTQSFANNFFSNSTTRDASAAQLIDGSAPVDARGFVRNDGTINAAGGIALRAGSVENTATIQTGASYTGTAPNFTDVVNTNGFTAGGRIVVSNGDIEIEASKEFTNTATIANVNGGDVSIKAPEVTLTGTAGVAGTISSRAGHTGSGGDIDVEIVTHGTLNDTTFDRANGSVHISAPVVDAGAKVAGLSGQHLDVDQLKISGTYATGGASDSWSVTGSINVADHTGITTSNPAAGHAAGNLTLQADQNITLGIGTNISTTDTNGDHAGNIVIEAGTSLTLRSATSLLANKSNALDDGGLVSLKSAGTLQLPTNLILEAGAITIEAGGDLTIPFSWQALDGDLSIKSGRDLKIGKHVTLSTLDDEALDAKAGNLTLQAGRDLIIELDVHLLVQSDAVADDGGSLSLIAGNNLVFTPDLKLDAGSVTISTAHDLSLPFGLTARDGGLSITSGGALSVAPGVTLKTVDGGGDAHYGAISLNATGALNLGRDVTIDAKGTADNDGGKVTLHTGDALNGLDGVKTLDAGSLDIETGKDLTLPHSISTKDGGIQVKSAYQINVAPNAILSTIDSDGGGQSGDLSLEAGTDLTLGSGVQLKARNTSDAGDHGGKLSLIAGNALAGPGDFTPVAGGFDMRSLAGFTIPFDLIAPNGDISIDTRGDLVIRANTTLSTIHSSGAVGDISVIAGKQLQLLDHVTLTADTAGADNGGKVTLKAGEALTFPATTVLQAGAIEISSGADLTLPFSLSAPDGILSVTTTKGNLTIADGLTLSTVDPDNGGDAHCGSLTLDAAGNLLIGAHAVLDANGSRGNDGGKISLLAGEGTLTLPASVTLDAGSLQIETDSDFAVPFNLRAPDGDITVRATGAITSTGSRQINALDGGSGAPGSVTLSGGSIALADGSVVQGGDLTVEATGNVSSPTLTADGSVRLTAGKTLTIPAGAPVQGTQVYASGDAGVVVDADITATRNDIVLKSGGSIDISSTLTASDGSFASTDAETSSGSIDIDAQGDVTFHGAHLITNAHDVPLSTYLNLKGNPDLVDLIEEKLGAITVDLSVVEDQLNAALSSPSGLGADAVHFDLADSVSLADMLRGRLTLRDVLGTQPANATINDGRTGLGYTTLLEALRPVVNATELLKPYIEQATNGAVTVEDSAITIGLLRVPFATTLDAYIPHVHLRELLPSDGNIEVTAKGNITFDGSGALLRTADNDKAGNIELRAGTTLLDRDAAVYAGSVVTTAGAAVTLDANGAAIRNDGGLILISGPSGVTLQNNTVIDSGSIRISAKGKGGAFTLPISLNARDGDLVLEADGPVTLNDGLTLTSQDTDNGHAGNLTVDSGGDLTIGNGVSLLAQNPSLVDDGGTITLHSGDTLTTPSNLVLRGGGLDIATKHSWTVPFDLFAPDGSIRLTSGGTLNVANNKLSAEDTDGAPGMAAGDIILFGNSGVNGASDLYGRNLFIGSGASLHTATNLTARGGNITLAAGDALTVGHNLVAASGTISLEAGADAPASAPALDAEQSAVGSTQVPADLLATWGITPHDDYADDAGDTLTVNSGLTITSMGMLFQSDGAMTVNSSLTTNRNQIALLAGHNLTINGDLTASDGGFGQVDVLQPSGSVQLVAGRTLTGPAETLFASVPGDLTINGKITTSAPDVTVGNLIGQVPNADVGVLLEQAGINPDVDLSSVGGAAKSAGFGNLIGLPASMKLATLLKGKLTVRDLFRGVDPSRSLNELRTDADVGNLLGLLQLSNYDTLADLGVDAVSHDVPNAQAILDAAGFHDLGDGLDALTPDVPLRSLLASDGNIEATAHGSITVAAGKTLKTDDDAAHTGHDIAGNIELIAAHGSVTLNDGVTLDADSSAAGTINDGGMIRLQSATGVAIPSNLVLQTGGIEIDGGSAALAIPVDISARDHHLVIESDGAITVAAGKTLSTADTDGTGKASDLTIDAGGNLTLGSGVSLIAEIAGRTDDGANLTLHSGGTLTTPNNTVLRYGALDITSGSSWKVPFNLNAIDGDLSVKVGGDLTFDSDVTVLSTLDSDGGGQSGDMTLESDGTLHLLTRVHLQTDDPSRANDGGHLRLYGGADLPLANLTYEAGSVDFEDGGALDVPFSISTKDGGIRLVAGTTLTMADNLTFNSVDTDGSGNSGAINLQAKSGFLHFGNNLSLRAEDPGRINDGGLVTLKGAMGIDLDAPGFTYTAGGFNIQTNGAFTLSRDLVVHDGNITVKSLDGRLTINPGVAISTLDTDGGGRAGDVTLYGIWDVSLPSSASLTGATIDIGSKNDLTLIRLPLTSNGGDIRLHALGDVTVQSSLHAPQGVVSLTAGRDLTINTGNAIDGVSIDAEAGSGNLTVSSKLTATDDGLEAQLQDLLESERNLSLAELLMYRSHLTSDDFLNTKGDVRLHAGGDVVVDNGIVVSANGGSITVEGTTFTLKPNAKLTAAAGTLALADLQSPDGSILIKTAGDVTIYGGLFGKAGELSYDKIQSLVGDIPLADFFAAAGGSTLDGILGLAALGVGSLGDTPLGEYASILANILGIQTVSDAVQLVQMLKVGNVLQPGGAIKIGSADGKISLKGSALLSTRQISGTDYLNGVSVADSGPIELLAANISLEPGARILAHAIGSDFAGIPYHAGDVALLVEGKDDVPVKTGFNFYNMITHSGSSLETATLIDLILQKAFDTAVEQKLPDDPSACFADPGSCDFLVNHQNLRIDITGATVKGGNVDIEAHVADRVGIVKDVEATINVTNSVITGDDVTIKADTETDQIPNNIEDIIDGLNLPTVSTLEALGDAYKGVKALVEGFPWDDAAQKLWEQRTNKKLRDALAEHFRQNALLELFDINLPVFFTQSRAVSTVTIDGTTRIETTGDVGLTARAQSLAAPEAGFNIPNVGGFGAAFADSTTSAQVVIAGSARIDAGGEVTVTARERSNVKPHVSITSVFGLTPRNESLLGLTWDKLDSQALVQLGDGAAITGAGVALTAKSENKVTSSLKLEQMGNGKVVTSNAINQYGAQTAVLVNGDVAATDGSVAIDAATDLDGAVVASATNSGDSSSLGYKAHNLGDAGGSTLDVLGHSAAYLTPTENDSKDPNGSALDKTIGVGSEALKLLITGALVASGKSSSFALSGAIAITTGLDFKHSFDGGGAVNDVQAVIGSTATATATKDLTVDAGIKDEVTIGSASSAESNGETIGGSLAWGTFIDHASAHIDGTADAGHTLAVRAQVDLPTAISTNMGNVLDALEALKLAPEAFIANGFGVNSAGGSDLKVGDDMTMKRDLGLAGSLLYLDTDITSEAYIAPHAEINQGSDLRSRDQTVIVDANTHVGMIDMGGEPILTIINPTSHGVSGSSVLGGAANVHGGKARAIAYIGEGAEVTAPGGVTVHATSDVWDLGWVVSGGQADNLGFVGTLTLGLLDNLAEAYIGAGATVDTDGTLEVTAAADMEELLITGGMVSGSALGIGLSASGALVKNKSFAHIGGDIGNTANVEDSNAVGSVNAGSILVHSDAVTNVHTYAVAGAFTSQASTHPSPEGAAITTGFALAGDSAVALVESASKAYVDGSFVVESDGNIEVTSAHALDIVAATGGASISTQDGASVAGSFSYVLLDDSTLALLRGELDVHNDGDVIVSAHADREILSGAANLSADVSPKGLSANLAGSVAYNVIDSDITAQMDDITVLPPVAGAPERDPFGSVLVEAIDDSEEQVFHFLEEINAFAQGIDDLQEFFGGKKDKIPDFNYGVSAPAIITVAGSLGVGNGGGSIGASVILNDFDFATRAVANIDHPIDGNAEVLADSKLGLITGGVALAVSVPTSGPGLAPAFVEAYTSRNNTTEAVLSGNATAQDSIAVGATSASDIFSMAGDVAGAKGAAAAGGASSTVLDTDTVKAYVAGSDSSVTAGGDGAGLTAHLADGTTKSVHGLSVLADSDEKLQTFAVGAAVAAGAAGGAGIQGSLTVEKLNELTAAYIADGADVNADNSTGTTTQDVDVYANDDTDVFAVAGAVGGGSAGGVGAGADVFTLGKTTEASIGTAQLNRSAAPGAANNAINAKRDVLVRAGSTEDIVSLAASIGAGKSVGLAGGASSILIGRRDASDSGQIDGLITRAHIGKGAEVTADGDVLVAAGDELHLDQVGGALGLGGSAAAFGGGVAVVDIDKTVEAEIDNDAAVDAGASGTGLTVARGDFTEKLTDDPSADAARASGEVRAPNVDQNGSDTQLLGKNREVTPKTTTVHGIAVTATDEDNLESLVVTGSASFGGGSVSVASLTTMLATDVRAHVGTHAQLNRKPGFASAGDQSVHIAAGSDLYQLAVGGAGAGGSAVGIAPGVVVDVLNLNTRAYVDDSAAVDAAGNVAIVANQAQKILSIAAGLGVGGTAGLAGAVTFIGMNNHTEAFADNGSDIEADGTVAIDAGDDTELDNWVGAAGVSATVGAGGSAVATKIIKRTTARTGTDVTLAGRGNATLTTPRQTTRGIGIFAKSREDVFATALAGAGGYAGGAGAVSVNLIDSDTTASIDNASQVNPSNTGASSAQDVSVKADNETDVGSSRVDLQACKLEYSIVSPK